MNLMIAIKDLTIHKEFEYTSTDYDHLYTILKSMKEHCKLEFEIM